ncbi:MAG: SPOR domain-containing protein, partial [Flavobacteriales bacterium]
MFNHIFSAALFGAFLMLSNSSIAQQNYNEVVDSALVIERDVRLDSLLMKHTRINKVKDGLDGYRVQLFSGSGTDARMRANNLRAEFLINHPKTPAYLIYQAPNFKVRLGDFRTELEAVRLQRELEYQYPGGFVVRDKIKLPKLAIEMESDEEVEIPELEEEPEDCVITPDIDD